MPSAGRVTTLLAMTERKPSDDLKEGLSLLFRAARGAAQEVSREIDVTKVEQAINTGARELARAIENVGKSLNSELEKNFQKEERGPTPPGENEEKKQ